MSKSPFLFVLTAAVFFTTDLQDLSFICFAVYMKVLSIEY